MGALKSDRMGPMDGERCPLDAPQMTKLVSPYSSFSSASSSYEKIAPPRSSSRLRRSTVDLSQIKSSTGIRSLQGSQQSQDAALKSSEGDRVMVSGGNHIEDFVEDTVFHYISLIQTVVLVETGLRTLVDEAKHHVGFFFGFLLNSFFANNSRALGEDIAVQGVQEDFEEPPPDPPLSPARVTKTSNSESKDEWGHFADFQEELADDKSFIPSCLPKTSSLETLDEDEDFEGDLDAFSF